jgi:hypothetical protein
MLLRGFTESAIEQDLEQRLHKNVKIMEKIVEDWMAVEEAIVGGIVYNRLKFLRGLICSSFNIDRTFVLVKTTCIQDHFREIIQGVKVRNFYITDDGVFGIVDPYFKDLLFCCWSHDPLQRPNPIRIQF